MANDLLQQFSNQAFTVGQQFAFQLQDPNKKMLLASVKTIEAADLSATIEGKASKQNKIQMGQLLPNSAIIFEKAESSALNLIGKSKGYGILFLIQKKISKKNSKFNLHQKNSASINYKSRLGFHQDWYWWFRQ